MHLDRRSFLVAAGGAVAGLAAPPAEPVIDIHQHTHYSGRSDEDLIAHQRALGITKTVLLPAGSKFGLAADAFGNDSVVALAKKYPEEFVFFANELPDIPETRSVLEKYLKMGALGIGEQKFKVDADSKPIRLIADIAEQYQVPVLLHFEHNTYNLGIERFHRVLEEYPNVDFIGHAQTWWGNIDKAHKQTDLYPKTKVTPGGITDELLTHFPNMYGDLSAGSGLNAMLRDEEHAAAFLDRHQNKLMFGSDCNDHAANTDACSGGKQLKTIRRLSPNAKATHKILYANAVRVIGLAPSGRRAKG